ncbi:complement C5-like [Plectropomus leopardus]|uniref:complement C5-like n=1 Tax=Plectropomus leopardus TaxID=160734 RepID=UPI001C4DA726|nr:complement C5-like [Plectropomus leopardus]
MVTSCLITSCLITSCLITYDHFLSGCQVPSDIFVCVGFGVTTTFRVGGASKSLFTVSEPQDKGSECSRYFSYEQQKLQRLCVDEQCQCMTAACAAYRGTIDLTLTAAKRTEETCKPHITYGEKSRFNADSL